MHYLSLPVYFLMYQTYFQTYLYLYGHISNWYKNTIIETRVLQYDDIVSKHKMCTYLQYTFNILV